MQPPLDSVESFKPNQLQEENFIQDIQGESPQLYDHQKEPSIQEAPQKYNKKVEFFESPPRGVASHKKITTNLMLSQGKISAAEKKRRSENKLVRVISKQQSSVFKRQIETFTESMPVTITMILVTLYALFGEDIRQLTSSAATDPVFYVLTIICMILFIAEIVLNCIAKPEYIFSFYFWLDSLATLTMLLDIGWISQSLFGGSSTNQSATQMKKIGSASKAGRRAGQVIRVIRLVRLVKLYKHANLQLDKEKNRKNFKASLMEQSQQVTIQILRPARTSIFVPDNMKQNYQQQHDINFYDRPINPDEEKGIKSSSRVKLPPIMHSPVPENTLVADQTKTNIRRQESSPADASPPYNRKVSETQQLLQPNSSNLILVDNKQILVESKVGQALQERTMRRVITIILSIVISVPLFNYETYKENIVTYQTGLDRLYQLESQPQLFRLILGQYIGFHASLNNPIIYVFVSSDNSSCCGYSLNSNFSMNSNDTNTLRDTETDLYLSFAENGDLKGYAITDSTMTSSINAGLSIIRTIFVCLVLAFSAIVLSKDVQVLVLDPIDRMLKKVDRIAKNPLEAAQFEEQEELIIEELEKSHDQDKIKENQEAQKMETAILEKLIMKIGALLAVGFGEAGSSIIAANMSQGGDVDPMLPGKKMLAIFGFCDIRNFTDATEVLQTGVMVFVNEIAEIVHGTADHYNGSANKNIGDAFLLVWKFRPEDYEPDKEDPRILNLIVTKRITQQADLSVISFLKIITGVSISRKLEKYKSHPGLNARLTNYSVKLGFGLHLGWAIEGAIGSNYKIDASYLSPNVNMASRLEAATKQFGSSILISGVLRQYLSVKCQKHLRHIDTVTVKGSVEPIEIHTVDISYKNLLIAIPKTYDVYDSASLSKQARKRFRVVNRFKRDQLREQVFSGSVEVADEFETDLELKSIRAVYTPEFYLLWKQAFDLYILGNWVGAKLILDKTLTLIPDHRDGPSNTLLQVIVDEGGKAPSSWIGCRELTEK